MKLDLNSYSVATPKRKFHGKYINREISWLNFNNRVIYCANNKNIPLNERIKFLAIANNNLDEFIAVRYSSTITEEPYNAKKVLHGIKENLESQFMTFKKLKDELKEDHDIKFIKVKNLDKKEKAKMKYIFMKDIFPLLTPVNIGSINEVPVLYNGQTCIAITVRQENFENLIIIPINRNIQKVFVFGKKVIMVEDIILSFLDDLFINKEIVCSGYFRIIKDENICINHDMSKFILDRMINTIEKREMSNPIFMMISSETDKRLQKIIESVFDIDQKNVFDKADIIDYTRFMNEKFLGDKYSYKPFEPAQYEIVEETHSLFTTLQKQDILLQHPYDSYDTVIKFIEHASIDPNVLTIKQTLYRVSSEDSPIVDALCQAAKRGKSVTVLIEIKARFDEQRNISLIEKLKKSGVNVLLGMEYLKTHCKLCIVIRKEGKSMVVYSHIGTGNYNEKTAKQYTDISYFTGKQKVGLDLLHIFNILSGMSTPDEKLQKVFYAPVNLRKRILHCIMKEIEYAKAGKKAEIFLKLNSINDQQIINYLYQAADKGVQVYLVVRGICSIVPKKNLYIKSIVGRFLEHSRIYYFRNGGKGEYYISSADMLTRNLDRRVEVLLSVTDYESMKKLHDIIKAMKEDCANSFEMNEEGNYKKLKGSFDCHQYFIDKANHRLKMKIAKRKKDK